MFLQYPEKKKKKKKKIIIYLFIFIKNINFNIFILFYFNINLKIIHNYKNIKYYYGYNIYYIIIIPIIYII